MRQFREMATFAAVGAAAAATHILTAIALIEQAGLAPWLANMLAFAAALPVSFFGHARVTFADKRRAGAETVTPTSFRRFAGLAATGFALNEGSIVLFVEHFGLPHRPVLVATALGVAALVYLASKFWAFAAPGDPAAA